MTTATPVADTRTQGWVISAALKKSDFKLLLLKECQPDDFVGPDRLLFEAIVKQGANHDPLAFQRLIAGAAHERLLEIEADFAGMPDLGVFQRWLKTVRDHSDMRHLQTLYLKQLEQIKPGADIEAIMSQGIAEAAKIRNRAVGDTVKPISEAVEKAKVAIQKWWQSGDRFADTVPTGFSSIDRILGGMARKHVTTLGGRPGTGKTQLALQIARDTALRSRSQDREATVIIFSAEMSDDKLAHRLAACASGVSTTAIRDRKASEEQKKKYDAALDKLAELTNIRIDESPAPTPTQMLSRVAVEAAAFKDGVDLVVFDYIELAGSEGNHEREEARIGAIMRGLKTIAKQFDCAVLAISQLNRDVENRPDRMPELSDLRASGWIENLSQTVMFVMRPRVYAYYDEKAQRWEYPTLALKEMANRYGDDVAIVRVAKNRDGDTGGTALRFIPEITRYEEFDQPSPPPKKQEDDPVSLEAAKQRLQEKEEAANKKKEKKAA